MWDASFNVCERAWRLSAGNKKGASMDDPVRIQLQSHTLTLSGVADAQGAAQLEAAVGRLVLPAGPLTVELGALDIADGLAAVALVNIVRRIARERHVTLCEAPQLLGHNLYRVGALDAGGPIALRALRDDEPYG